MEVEVVEVDGGGGGGGGGVVVVVDGKEAAGALTAGAELRAIASSDDEILRTDASASSISVVSSVRLSRDITIGFLPGSFSGPPCSENPTAFFPPLPVAPSFSFDFFSILPDESRRSSDGRRASSFSAPDSRGFAAVPVPSSTTSPLISTVPTSSSTRSPAPAAAAAAALGLRRGAVRLVLAHVLAQRRQAHPGLRVDCEQPGGHGGERRGVAGGVERGGIVLAVGDRAEQLRERGLVKRRAQGEQFVDAHAERPRLVRFGARLGALSDRR